MAKPVNRSYFPLRRQLPEHKTLTRKQAAHARKALKRRGLKMPKPGWCTITTKIGGRNSNLVVSSRHSTNEICASRINGKIVYEMRAHPRRTKW